MKQTNLQDQHTLYNSNSDQLVIGAYSYKNTQLRNERGGIK